LNADIVAGVPLSARPSFVTRQSTAQRGITQPPSASGLAAMQNGCENNDTAADVPPQKPPHTGMML